MTGLRAAPLRVTLGVRDGHAPSRRPPVRVFLGSEPAQYRAERVFVWSIEQVRDPSRVYEIHVMRSLAGFASAGWTTGFTNYRFAIPHFCAGTGRAIYNDVDQIYLADPAALFDLDLGEHGIRAVAPDDLSVMVLDCARVAGLWTLADAQRESKQRLLARAAAVPGLIGGLAPEWNVRDEIGASAPRVFHFTTLHLQPWRPFPERYAYQENPSGELWHRLERSADAAGFQVFSRHNPSDLFRPEQAARLEDVPEDDLAWQLDERFAAGGERLAIAVKADRARGAAWWAARVGAAAARHPDVRWELRVEPAEGGAPEVRGGGRRPSGDLPSVWVLVDDRPGNATQALGLAGALDWPTEIKRLHCGPLARLHNRLLGASLAGLDRRRSSPLQPPWPELVIAAGRRTAPVARWIGRQARGRTRLVAIGRKAADCADDFDLCVTPAYTRLFPHPNRVETGAPLHRVTAERLAEAADRWRERLQGLPRPRIALLVGGTSGQYRLDAATARRLGEDVMRLAADAGGSALVSTSRRTGPAATRALRTAMAGAAFAHWWSAAGGDNPYLGMLALADALVITGDSESMLAEAGALGRPLFIYPLPVRPSFRLLRVPREWVVRRATALPAGPRGTARPQQRLEYLCARAIERGWVRPTRDLEVFHADLVRRGVARPFGAAWSPTAEVSTLDDLEVVARRVRALLGVPEPAASAARVGALAAHG